MLPFFEVLRMMAEMEGEETPDNFHILPSSNECWIDIFEKSKERCGLLCLEFTGNWSTAARRVQRLFVRLASKTSVPFLRVEVARGILNSHTAVKGAVGGVTAVPTYAIMNFAQGKVEVHKFEGSTAIETGAFEARLREIASQRQRERESKETAKMLGDVFSLAFAAAELEALKKKKADQQRQNQIEREQQGRIEHEAIVQREQEQREQQKQERIRLLEIEKEQERRRQEEQRLRERPMHVQDLLKLDLEKVAIREIKSIMEKMHISYVGCTSRQDLITQLVQQVPELRLKREEKAPQAAAACAKLNEATELENSPNKHSGLDLKSASVSQLKARLKEMGISTESYVSKEDMVQAINDAQSPKSSNEHVNMLRAQHFEQKLRTENERLELRQQQLEKKLLHSEDRERALNRDLTEAQQQSKAMEGKLARAEQQVTRLAGEINTLKRRNAELESMGSSASTNSSSRASQAASSNLMPGCFNQSSEDRVQELERTMLDMMILFTTKAEDYDVVKLIDSGCEGAVHLVQCSRSELRDTKRLYALKTVFNIFGHQTVSKVCQQHENEYQTLSVLPKHRNIVNLYAFFFDRLDSQQFQLPPDSQIQARSVSLFMVMEYQPKTLKGYVEEKSRGRGVQAAEVLSWTYQLLTAVDFLNARNVVHRDLKMDNILYSDEGVVKLCDFGYSIQLDPGMKMPLTAGMSKGGNAAHLAPEVHLARPGRGRTVDYSKQAVWATGVLCYEMCNHRSPFDGILDQCGYGSDNLPPLAAIQASTGSGASLPNGYQKFVKSLLEFVPRLRPTSSEAIKIVKRMIEETNVPQFNRF